MLVVGSCTSWSARVAPSVTVNFTGFRIESVLPILVNSFLKVRCTLLAATRLFSKMMSVSLLKILDVISVFVGIYFPPPALRHAAYSSTDIFGFCQGFSRSAEEDRADIGLAGRCAVVATLPF